jgi:thiaminase/transcriptional activator TenA
MGAIWGRPVKFSDRLLKAGFPVWEKILRHPFVLGIGDGSLPMEPFKFYVCQDYVFLVDYARVLALAVIKGTRLPMMGKLAGLLHATLNTEMALHRSYCARFGIAAEDLEATRPAPTTYAYTRHLLHTAASGSLGEIVAALFPCQWGYWEIGRRFAAEESPGRPPLYTEWIKTYSSQEYGALAHWVRELLDEQGESASKEERARMETAFITSSRYEYTFWEMAWRKEEWLEFSLRRSP